MIGTAPKRHTCRCLLSATIVIILVIMNGIAFNTLMLRRISVDVDTLQNPNVLPSDLKHDDEPILSNQLLSLEGMKRIGTRFARYFPVSSNFEWCVSDTNETIMTNKPTSYHGLLYVKVPKAASSTIASVVHRISHNNGRCSFRNEHKKGTVYGANRIKNESFLLASIRNPASRAISRVFYYHVSQKGLNAKDKQILKVLNSTDQQLGAVSRGKGGFQLNYMTTTKIPNWSAWNPHSPTEVKNKSQILDNVRETLEAYDFIVVVERMNESLVVLSMLLQVSLGDIITLDSNVQGMYQYHYPRKKCFKIVKSHVSPRVKEYLSSSLWFAQNFGDYVFHAAANASLDKTIDMLGRSRVEARVKEYHELKAQIHEKCASAAIFPCSLDGRDQMEESQHSCYTRDQGCGHECIDTFIMEKRVAH